MEVVIPLIVHEVKKIEASSSDIAISRTQDSQDQYCCGYHDSDAWVCISTFKAQHRPRKSKTKAHKATITMAQKHTVTDLRNGSGHALSLSGHEVWEGSQSTDFPKTIMDGDRIQFTHNAGTDDGSIAAVAYKLQDDGKMWVVAWSNPRGADSKVYMLINCNIHFLTCNFVCIH
ncbi:hypothetical protein PVK06_036663 [Gossypium arboreum]|uniref:Uncharacterized protein n=1 Tax=Gossypium arboreum TaxID=29729 RepID=A0ABR0NK49_GOSAR|nr:hypothetical protein PVK06_036663 [Gossypium arboreum]